jgi:hypothetical protein
VTSIDIQLDGDNCWPDLDAKADAGQVSVAELVGVALLPDAIVTNMLTGAERRVPAVTLRLHLPDGRIVLAQLKVEMLETLARAMRGRLDYLAELKAKGGRES